MLAYLIIFLSVYQFGVSAKFDGCFGAEQKCGYSSCPVTFANKLNIHLVPHSHDDLGWLNTVNEYYQREVQSILTTAVDELLKNAERRFVYAETGFFWLWWNEQSETVKQNVRCLVNEGRLEFVNGGWSMPDEAVSHYQSLIDQYTWGFRRLNDTFGRCGNPRSGWQIDPFGHSRELSSLFSQFGFDGNFFARIDHEDKKNRLNNKEMEFLWYGNPSLDKRDYLFTSVLYHHYNVPRELCFDSKCNNWISHANLQEKISFLIDFATEQSNYYKTNNVLLTMGDDFHYINASKWYSALDLLKDTGNDLDRRVNIIYSTPTCYLKSVHNSIDSLTTKFDDFFPYSDNYNRFWTGYYTSRPSSKYFERRGNNQLQVAKQLSVITNNRLHESALEKLRQVMGVFQHHDAITGTEKQYVAEDYHKVLHQRMTAVEPLIVDSIRSLLVKDEASFKNVDFFTCLNLNTSSCQYSEESDNFVVTIYNPTNEVISPYIRLPVVNHFYRVQNYKGEKVNTQMVPISEFVESIPGRNSSATHELVFQASDLDPLGFQSFYISRMKTRYFEKVTNKAINYNSKHSARLSDGRNFEIYINKNSLVITEQNSSDITIEQMFHFYTGSNFGQSSGAYVFRPDGKQTFEYPKIIGVSIGDLVYEMQIAVSPEINQILRIYSHTNHIEFDFIAGPLQRRYSQSFEVVTTYSIKDLRNEGTFYTDSNGRSTIKRRLNERPTWVPNINEPIAGNYYPITSKITIQDEKQNLRCTVLTDRSQGGASLEDGKIELMLHRRTSRDDGLGVAEALDEIAFKKPLVIRGQHYLLVGKSQNQVVEEKSLSSQLLLKPFLLFTPTNKKICSFKCWTSNFNMKGSGITRSLPKSVKILTLEPWKNETILLRLEHVFEKGDHEKYSKRTVVDLQNLFSTFVINDFEEVTLGANMHLGDFEKLKWTTNDIENTSDSYSKNDNKYSIELRPQEIRTFILDVSYNK